MSGSTKTAKRKAAKKHVVEAIAYVHATFNNTIITVVSGGDVLATSSAGACNFKGSRKSTPFAAQEAVKRIVEKVKSYGVKRMEVRVKGPGGGRESAVREFYTQGFQVTGMTDITPLPHNGCRPPKERRA